MPSPTASTTEPREEFSAPAGRSRQTDALALVRLAAKAAAAYGRPDLVARLDALVTRIDDRRVTVVVIGEFKAGKSALVNALIGADVCPVDVAVATAVTTVIEFADHPIAEVFRGNADGGPAAEEIDPAEARAWIRGQRGNALGVRVALPRPLLADGLVVVDTPGVGGLDARHVAQSLGILSTADVVLFVADGANELGGPALDLLALVQGVVPHTELVLTKSDLSHHIDDVAEANRVHLQNAGLDVAMHVVSSDLHRHANAVRDHELDRESGLPFLLTRLGELAGDNDNQVALAAAAAVDDVAEQLRQVFIAERAAITDQQNSTANTPTPSTPAPGAGSWQQLLSDEIADLSSDLEFELRRRSRGLITEAENSLADGDPDELWPEVTAWLAERAAADVVSTFSALRDRTLLIATRVAERFDLSGEATSPVDVTLLDDFVRDALASMPEHAALSANETTKATKGLSAFRSTFTAFTMFSTIGALVGITAAPAALVLGLVVGGKSARDEKKKSYQQRRTQAKAAIRLYIDEVSLIAGKESRDALRLVQRALRDHFGALADQRQRTLAAAAAAARRAQEADRATQAQRVVDIDAELTRLDTLTQRARALDAIIREVPT
jgi:hypothetical protein